MRDFSLRPTIRGWTVAGFGIVAAIAAALVGEPDLVWVGLFLVILPLVAAIIAVVTRPSLTMYRSVEPEFVPIGSRPHAVLDLSNRWAGATSALDFVDQLPDELGHDARFSLVRGAGKWRQAAHYEIRADHRGHFRLGPLAARSYDPLGLICLTWPVAGDSTRLRITPRIWSLGSARTGGGAGSASDSTPQRIGQAGSDDVLVREHRHGDDMRRVHWRLSAKQGELMVRLEEHPWEPTVVLLIDNRRSAHLRDGPSGTLEWSVSLVASVADDLLSQRYKITLLSSDGMVTAPGQGSPTVMQERMLNALTDLTASPRPHMVAGLDVLGPSDARTLVAALGLLTPADATALTALSSGINEALAVAPDARSFGVPSQQLDAHTDALRLLAAAGWTIHSYGLDEPVPEAWASLQTRGHG
ncbi:MAG: DUF58 domain-containing protein [Arachnia sp.]